MHLGRSGIGAFLSKTKVTLIHCVFSGSDVGSKWWLLYSLLHPSTKHLNHLIWDILSSPAPEADSSQLTQGGSKVRRSCQSTIVGGACTELHHSDRNLRTAWVEKGDIKKKHWVDFYHYRVDVYTHFQHTFMFKQHVKWILHLMTPLMSSFSGLLQTPEHSNALTLPLYASPAKNNQSSRYANILMPCCRRGVVKMRGARDRPNAANLRNRLCWGWICIWK